MARLLADLANDHPAALILGLLALAIVVFGLIGS